MDGKFKVTTKAALYSEDMKNILTIYMSDDDFYGLPGGHVHTDEVPDDAIVRELFEEAGLKNVNLERRDFFRHSNGKMILAYMGTLPCDCEVLSQQDNLEGEPKWVSRADFMNIDIEPGYREFAVRNWPQL